MKKQDFNQRITLIVSEDLPFWQALNTVGHLSAYFGNQLTEKFGTGPYFKTADEVNLPRNTQYPIVILKASKILLTKFAKKMRQNEEVQKMYFIKEMIESTNDERIEALVSLQMEEELEYLGVGLFGDNGDIKKLTSNFKLWS